MVFDINNLYKKFLHSLLRDNQIQEIIIISQIIKHQDLFYLLGIKREIFHELYNADN